MKIERIDDKTVKCFISNEELEEFEITYMDFVTRSDKAKEIVEEIIEQAMEQVDYKPPKFAMDMQIMMVPEKGMLLTISERTPEDVKNNPMIKEYLKEMQKSLEEHFGEIAAQAKAEQAKGTSKQGNKVPDFAIFAFASIRDLCDYSKILPRNLRVASSLYKMEDKYYLYLHKGNASYERYSRACIQAMEYGRIYGATEEKVLYLQEYAQCILEEKALAKLRLS